MQCSLPEFDADQAAAACQTFCTAYAALAREASKKKQGKAWNMKPKLHMFQELAEYQAKELGNPADFWNYKDEDFMRLVSAISGRKGGLCMQPVLLKLLSPGTGSCWPVLACSEFA